MLNISHGKESIETRSGTMAFRVLLDNLDQGVYFLDREGRFLAVNRVFRRWLNRPESELLGRTFVDFCPARSAQREALELQRVLRGERIEKEEEWPSGRRVLLLRILKVPVADAEGRVCGVLGLLREAVAGAPPPGDEEGGKNSSPAGDAAERRNWNYELLGRLLSGFLHDLRNLLTLQVNELALLQSILPGPGAAEESLENLRKASDWQAALIERLLALVGGHTSPAALDVNAVCNEVAALLKTSVSGRIALELALCPAPPPVHVAAADLRRVLLNLCLNACDAMPAGGSLRIETERPDDGDCVWLRVRDSGAGMTPEVQARIFHPFFTTKATERNRGQGLDIVADLVRQMGGAIECKSISGEGTCFTLRLPAAAPPAEMNSRIKKILLVENEPSIVPLVRAILEPRGFQVVPAENGRRAVEIYRHRQTEIEVVLLERDLPELSGLETMRELLHLNPHARIVLVGSAETEPSISGRGYLKKPYTPEELLQAVSAIIASP